MLGEIDLSADELPAIDAMIRYLYTGDYSDTVEVKTDSTRTTNSTIGVPASSATVDTALPLLFNVKMYVCADKFDILGLRTLATKKYQACVTKHWNNVRFSEFVTHLWGNTVELNRELRNVVFQAAQKHIKELLDRSEFRDLMKDHGDFAYDVIRAVYGRPIGVTSQGDFESKAILGREVGRE